jgi:hypothetical protein
MHQVKKTLAMTVNIIPVGIVVRSLAAVLGEYDAYNGLFPPILFHAMAQKKDDERHFEWSDEFEVVDLDADRDDGYHD